MAQHWVALRYRDYRNHHWKVMWLACELFIQRFLLHVLPKGLMHIRHYGFLANACRAHQLPCIRQAMQTCEAAQGRFYAAKRVFSLSSLQVPDASE
jgi:hypothetical protein